MTQRVFNISAAAAAFISLALFVMVKPSHALQISVSGNGAESDSTINTTVSQQTAITQTNTATINNNIDATAQTGGNEASGNTGGDVTIDTGNATVQVGIDNSVNNNGSQSTACCDPGSSVSSNSSNSTSNNIDITVSGNGAGSHNFIDPNFTSNRFVRVTNNANINNNVMALANTGDNIANRNTGGDVLITTGDANVLVNIDNNANNNETGIGGPEEETPEEEENQPEGEIPTPTTLAAVPPVTTTTPSPEELGGQVLASVLPVTGVGGLSWVMFAALLLTALGYYLRRKTQDWYYHYYRV